MEVKVVLGHTFGDEGKGVTVQWLCKKAIEEGKKPVVVRYSGGPQAAHTVFHGGTEHICSSFGSGVLLGVPTILFGDTYVDPICLMNEYRVLKEKGIEPDIDFQDNRIITPYDVLAGRNNETVRSDGTCGKGLFATFDRCNHSGKVEPKFYLNIASDYHNIKHDEEYDALFSEAYRAMATTFLGSKWANEYDVVIFEGSQGLLLDMDCGFFPHVTPSRVGLNGIPKIWLQDADVYLVTRTYTTRHGNGYEPQYGNLLPDLSQKHETNVQNEFQGEFKTGLLDTRLLNTAYQRHCLDNYVAKYNCKLNLVVTHTDVWDSCNYFTLINKAGTVHDVVLTNPVGYENICHLIANELVYKPEHIYYNDSVESNIKQYK